MTLSSSCETYLGSGTWCACSKLKPDILMMRPANNWKRCDAADLLRPPEIRCIFIQREMGSGFVVIRSVSFQNIAQVRFAEHDEVVE